MPAKGSKIVTQQDFDTIKSLLSAGLSFNLIAKSLKRSWGVVQQVDQSDTFEDYKAISYARWEAHKAKKRAEEAGLIEEANVVMGGGDEPVPFNLPDNVVSTPTADFLRIFNKLDELISRLDKIIDYEEAREASVKVNGWKLGRSR